MLGNHLDHGFVRFSFARWSFGSNLQMPRAEDFDALVLRIGLNLNFDSHLGIY